MGDIDIFDEWGNFVGTFTPDDNAGLEGGLAVLVIMICLAIFAVFFFVFFLFLKLTIRGFQATLSGNWEKALKLWIFPSAVVGFCAIGLTGIFVDAQLSKYRSSNLCDTVTVDVKENTIFVSNSGLLSLLSLSNDIEVELEINDQYRITMMGVGSWTTRQDTLPSNYKVEKVVLKSGFIYGDYNSGQECDRQVYP